MSATLLPNGSQVFLDLNGDPLVAGAVWFYTPGTTTLKDTWQDAGQTILNSNPVLLDAAGRAVIYGSGVYRQVVYDSAGNQIWDQQTTDSNTVGGNGIVYSAYGTNAIALDWSYSPPANLLEGYVNGQYVGFVVLSDAGAPARTISNVYVAADGTTMVASSSVGTWTWATTAGPPPSEMAVAAPSPGGRPSPDRLAQLEERIAVLEAWVTYWRQQAR